MSDRWHNALPKPVAFVFSGGAALGALQVGMLRALRDADIRPDLVVGTSVGALNGAVIADRGLDEGILALEALWRGLRREDVFPGGRLARARQFISSRVSIFPNGSLGELVCRMLTVDRFDDLQIPFGALATELISYHGALFTAGQIHPALLASAAIPGVYPPVEINGVTYVDGALTAHVPLGAAAQMGAKSLVVLEAGDTCHRKEPPRHAAEMMLVSLHAALRQRVVVEAPAIAARMPVLYLPTPCPISKTLLDFSASNILMTQAAEMTAAFLQDAPIPQPGQMTGAPHFHDDVAMEGLIRVCAV
ncbi:MAG: patatin-like phospholipase family protein [Anaerolineae bacterium]